MGKLRGANRGGWGSSTGRKGGAEGVRPSRLLSGALGSGALLSTVYRRPLTSCATTGSHLKLVLVSSVALKGLVGGSTVFIYQHTESGAVVDLASICCVHFSVLYTGLAACQTIDGTSKTALGHLYRGP